MLIGERIRAIREGKKLSQGDIEKRCGLLHVYISRVEDGHIVPSIATLEKLARALEVPLYQLFYERKERPLPPHLPQRKRAAAITWGTTRQEIYFWKKFRGFLAHMSESERRMLLYMAQKIELTSSDFGEQNPPTTLSERIQELVDRLIQILVSAAQGFYLVHGVQHSGVVLATELATYFRQRG